MNSKKRILVAPLDWGLGHASRCVPIAKTLEKEGYEVVFAASGRPLELLIQEFPKNDFIKLEGYNISYPKNGQMALSMLSQLYKIWKGIRQEHKQLQQIIDDYNIDGVISDNRYGLYSKKVPCVFVTHQLQIQSPILSETLQKINFNYIQKFDECWVPDHKGEHNLSGDLGQDNVKSIKTKYIGPLSRFQKHNSEIKYDLLVLLSGPEPQRTFLEQKLLNELEYFNGSVLFVKGLIETTQKKQNNNNITIYNYMASGELEEAINKSEIVLSRSGYTTIMDLAKLEKKAFFIPTPGQFEQEYLANRLNELKIIPCCSQDDFKIEMLNNIEDYSGFKSNPFQEDFENLFSLF